MLVLQIGTGAAVIRWFTRRPAGGENAWTRLIAPALSALLLTAVLVLGVANLSLLTGAGWVANLLILLPLVVAVGAGLMIGGRTRRAPADPRPRPEGARS